MKRGARNYDEAMASAAWNGQMKIVEKFRAIGATAFKWAMRTAADGGHSDIVEKCKQWLAVDFHVVVVFKKDIEGRVQIVSIQTHPR